MTPRQVRMARRTPIGSLVRLKRGATKQGQLVKVLGFPERSQDIHDPYDPVLVQTKPFGKGRHKNRMKVSWRLLVKVTPLEALAEQAE